MDLQARSNSAALTPSETAKMPAALERVLASPGFASAPRRSHLLRHIVERTLVGKNDQITEYGIGIDVFGRPASFDPRLDSIVRTETSRLRQKLREYYAGPGSGEPFLIEIAQRSYAAVFVRGKDAAAEAELPASVEKVAAHRVVPRFAWAAIALIAAGLAVSGIALRGGWTAAPLSSVVVLPFQDYSPDRNAAYLADGITEEFTNRLAQERGLRVVARTSASVFKNQSADIREIGRKLNAGAVLEGSISKEGEMVRITAQLNRTSDGYHLWSRSLEAPYRDLAAVEEQITQSVEVALLKREAQGGRAMPNPEAHDAYLQAAYQLSRQTPESVGKAMNLFKQAIAADASYVDAYRGLARAEVALVHFTADPPLPMLQRSREALEKALEIDPENGDALGQLGMVDYVYFQDWPRAERDFRLAIEHGATGSVHSVYAWSLATRGRFDEGRREIDIAQNLDPMGAGPRFNLGMLYLLAHRFPEAKRVFRDAVADGISVLDSRYMLGVIGYYERDCATAATEIAAVAAKFPAPAANFGFALAAACGGHMDEAHRFISKAKAAGDREYVSQYQLAITEAAVGDRDAAIAALQQSAEAREAQVFYLKYEPAFADLRSDARYVALEKRVGVE
jgi:TolB-like protein/Tfp pilus assembly protein PilF